MTTYDYMGRQVGTYTGTDDTIGTNNFEAFVHQVNANATNVSGTNMTLISFNQYDNGGVGDGNLTQVIQYPGGSQAPRLTENLYNWQDQLITTKQAQIPISLTSDYSPSQPFGWSQNDVGSPELSGNTFSDGSTFVVSGGGSGFGTTSDQVGYFSKGYNGWNTISVRVSDLTESFGGGEAGVMVRTNNSVGSVFAAVEITASGNVEF